MRGVETRLSVLGSGFEVRPWRWKLYMMSLAIEGGYSLPCGKRWEGWVQGECFLKEEARVFSKEEA